MKTISPYARVLELIRNDGNAEGRRFPGILTLLAAGSAVGIGTLAVITVYRFAAAAMGKPLPNCSEADFMQSSLSGLTLAMAFTSLHPALVMFFYGGVRIGIKRPYGYTALAMAAAFTMANGVIFTNTWHWLKTTSRRSVHETAQNELSRYAAARERLSPQKANATAIEIPGAPFPFSGTGTVALVAAAGNCFTAEARHECLSEPLVWDSCKGGLQAPRTRNLGGDRYLQ